ncbi:hypothetical protein COS75_01575 [Candidatus Pacearchaeota archaeon CG06_land_8_20_14_3_00_35_12]|nr:MAG: hypothetical protein COS75_01575 [Candidatus Pacearchaeota archaeon CG06_land_8_20_14_3_00_35_12]
MANFLIEFIGSQPLISIILISFLISLFFTWLYKKTSNQERIKELKKKQKELQEKMKSQKNEPEKMLETQNEMLNLSSEMMKLSMKPMLISMVPVIIIFPILGWLYTTAGVGNIMPWNFYVWGLCDWRLTKGLCNGAGWFLSYIIFSLIFSPILRKMMKAE